MCNSCMQLGFHRISHVELCAYVSCRDSRVMQSTSYHGPASATPGTRPPSEPFLSWFLGHFVPDPIQAAVNSNSKTVNSSASHYGWLVVSKGQSSLSAASSARSQCTATVGQWIENRLACNGWLAALGIASILIARGVLWVLLVP